MMTHELQVSMLAAPLAAIDRRSLSQAWYSALRLGTERQAPLRTGVQTPVAQETRSKAPAGASIARHGSTAAAIRLRVAMPQELRVDAGLSDRRRVRTPLALRIAGTLREPPSVRRTSFRVGTGAQRAFVMLQPSGCGARLVAICAPKARAAVERALAQARYALAARGIDLDCSVNEAAACS